MSRPKWRRHRIVTVRFQYSLLAISFCYFMVILLAFSAVLFGPLVISLNDSTLSPEVHARVADQFLTLHGRIWPPMLIILMLLGLHSMFVSHRIAGPLYRIKQVLQDMAKGNLTARAVLRKGDYLFEDAEVLNQALQELESRVSDIQNAHRHLDGCVRTLGFGLDGAADRSTRESMAAVEAQLTDLKDKLERLQTSSQLEPVAVPRAQRQQAGGSVSGDS